MTPWETEVLKEYLENEEKVGKIRKSYSPAGAPVMFVEKADGSLRLVVDYHHLNNITIKDRHPLPLQEDLIEKFKHAMVFTKLDLCSGYNNIWIQAGDEWKTMFRMKFGHYKYIVMPYGLTNAPAVSQRLMNNIFHDFLDIYVIMYLDNILIHSESKEEHVGHVKEVLKQLQQTQLYCNPKKVDFFIDRVTYIGLVITPPEGISMEKDKVQAVLEWPIPNSVKEVQSFLGFANFDCQFVPNFSHLAHVTTLDWELDRGGISKVNCSWRSKSNSLSSFIASKRQLTTQSKSRAN
jgi:hypothetical protein